MRIVAGTWRGRPLSCPRGTTTRPTSDRVREAIFSSIEARHPEALAAGTVLDAFAGSGALALEALSRGARSATAVEIDARALDALSENARGLAADSCTIVRGDVFALARKRRIPGGPFSLLLLDPPYRIERAQVRGLLDELVAGGFLLGHAIVVAEHAKGQAVDWPDTFELEGERIYGDTAVSVAVFARSE